MTAILVTLSVLLLMLMYLLLAPLVFEINSIKGIFGIRFHYIASVRLLIDDATLIAIIRAGGWTKRIDLLSHRKSKTRAPMTKKKRKNRIGRLKRSLSRIASVIQSFKVRKCELDVDTGSEQLNGILYPVFYVLGTKTQQNISINFVDNNSIILIIDNTLARMIRAYIFHH